MTSFLIFLFFVSFSLFVFRLKNIILSLVVLEILLLFGSCLILCSLVEVSLVIPFFITLLVFIVVEAVLGLLIFISGLSSTGSFYLKFSTLTVLS
jgi:hypothetical protein